MTAVESAETIDADASGIVLVHQFLHGDVHDGRFPDIRPAGLDDLLGCFDPAVGEPAGSLLVGLGVGGGQFRKVQFGDQQRARGGILAQGTFLIVTSNPTRTSPVSWPSNSPCRS